MGRYDDGRAFRGARHDHLLDVADPERVEPRQRLVEDQRRRVVQEPARQSELLPHAARQLAGHRPFLSPQFHDVEQLARLSLDIGDTVQPRDETQVLDDGQVLEQLWLVGDERQATLRLDRVRDDIVAVDRDGAGARRLDAHDAPERGRLAGAVGANQADDLAALYAKRQAADGGEPAIEFREVLYLNHRDIIVGLRAAPRRCPSRYRAPRRAIAACSSRRSRGRG